MAKYMTRTVDTYIYHLGSIENSGDATTIIPVTDIFQRKEAGRARDKEASERAWRTDRLQDRQRAPYLPPVP